MEAVSAVTDVLKVRVTIDALPEAYSVKIRRVGDPPPTLDGSVIDGTAGEQAGLSEFYD